MGDNEIPSKSVEKYRESHACQRDLTIFEFFSYHMFFVHALCGSNLTIMEFLDLTEGNLFKKVNTVLFMKKCFYLTNKYK